MARNRLFRRRAMMVLNHPDSKSCAFPEQDQQLSASDHCQNRRLGSRWLFILPEHWRDTQRFLLLNQARQVVAEQLAAHFVDRSGGR
jgi:hypothetical protein